MTIKLKGVKTPSLSGPLAYLVALFYFSGEAFFGGSLAIRLINTPPRHKPIPANEL